MIEEDEMFETVLLAFQNGAFVAREEIDFSVIISH